MLIHTCDDCFWHSNHVSFSLPDTIVKLHAADCCLGYFTISAAMHAKKAGWEVSVFADIRVVVEFDDCLAVDTWNVSERSPC